MDVRLTWTDCDEAGDYVVPNVLSLRDLVSRPDKMDKTVLHTGTVRSVLDLNNKTHCSQKLTMVNVALQ